jgi:hypothetical protein
MTTLPAFAPRQFAGDLAPILKYIEVAPTQLFSVIIAKDHPSIFGTPNRFPKPRCLLDLQKNSTGLFLEAALTDLPVQPQSQ